MAAKSRVSGKQATHAVALRRARGERGSTLVELLIATVIMGTAVVAILVGTSATFTSSGANRQSTTAGIVARNYAESLDLAVSQGAWCSTAYAISYTPPAGYTAAVTYIDPCPPTGAQFQNVTITVTQPNGFTETLKTVVRQP